LSEGIFPIRDRVDFASAVHDGHGTITMNGEGTQSLTVSLLNTDSFEAMGKEWNQLLETSAAKTLFLTWEWTFTWWQVYGSAYQLFLLKVQDKTGKCVGLAPFKIARRYTLGIIPHRQVEFIGYCRLNLPDYLDLIFAPDYQEQGMLAVWAYLMDHKHLWDTLYFSDIPTASGTHSGLSLLAKEVGLVTEMTTGTPCPYLPLTGSWQAYLKSLSPNARYNIQRKEKRLVKSYPLSFEEISAHAHIQEALEDLFHLHKTVWNAKGEKGSFDRHPLNKPFHRRLVDRLSELGWVMIYNLKIDGKPAALLYAYTYDNRVFLYQMGRELKWTEWGIGQVLMQFILQSLFKKGVSEFDFLRGTESYKYHWTKLERVNMTLAVWNMTAWGKIVCMISCVDRWGRRLLSPIRRSVKEAFLKIRTRS